MSISNGFVTQAGQVLGMRDLKGGKDPVVVRKDDKPIVILGQNQEGQFLATDNKTGNLITYEIRKAI